jgi:F420-non-reducing hydrogenase large subunit
MARQVVVNPVTRIEGHAKIVVNIDDAGGVDSAHLQVLEIRGFERLLEGTELFKMPQITARLCGVCPAAHHLASVMAIERGLGIEVPRDAQLLRELLYAGHILHSHALSNFVLTGPDVLLGVNAESGTRNVFSLLRFEPELSKKLLRIRSIGQRTVELVGGRGVHPVAAVPGGMASRPDAVKLGVIAGWGAEAIELLEQIGAVLGAKLAGLGGLRSAVKLPHHSLALSNDNVVSYFDGFWIVLDCEGHEERRFSGSQYADHLVEHVMPGSYMKSVRLRSDTEKSFFVGPLARLNVNSRMSTPRAHTALTELRAGGTPRLSAVDYIKARFVEMIHCAERMAELAGDEIGGGPVRIPAAPREGRFVSAIEAPRGILVHDYTADGNGRVCDVNLIVATQNNYDAIDHALTSCARHLVPLGDDAQLMNGVELTLRCFDPCLACATHVGGRMPIEIELRQGDTVRTLTREGVS